LSKSASGSLRPHLDAIERTIAAQAAGAAPPSDHQSVAVPAEPEFLSYKDLRPHLRPSLFEALRPQVEAFQRTIAARAAPCSRRGETCIPPCCAVL
jgi:muramidase (phage lysozyme)